MPDQPPTDEQYPATPEGDYRKAADTIRAAIDREPKRDVRASLARVLGDLAIRMTAAQNGAGLAAVAPPKQ